MIAADLGQQGGPGQTQKLGGFPTIAAGVSEHCCDLPTLHRLEWLRRGRRFTQGFPQALKIQLWQAQIQHQEARAFTGCPHRGRRECGCC